MELFGGSHGIIMTFIIGLIVGIVAKFLMPGKDPGGFIITAIIGIIGSFVATWLGQAVGWYHAGQTAGFIGSVIGAIILLLIYHLVRRNTAS
ncbi:MAG: GlsB/YeaQ/YmgE family stress response membrane protein [Dokdonella sp.]